VSRIPADGAFVTTKPLTTRFEALMKVMACPLFVTPPDGASRMLGDVPPEWSLVNTTSAV